jgi:hypothetical protein
MLSRTSSFVHNSHSVALPPQFGKQPCDFKSLSQPRQDSVHCSGDAFKVFNDLKHDQGFKKICDIVVWQKDGKSLNVAEMIAFLCRKRNADNYPGYGTVERLSYSFPGLNTRALEDAFQALHYSDDCFLGHDRFDREYWLRPIGLKKIIEIYPDMPLPPKGEIFIYKGETF